MNTEYKVCILAAGETSRVSYAEGFNIALLPVGSKAALTRIIEKFPKETEIVIAIGYNGHLIKEFVQVAYTDRRITFVDVDRYKGKGSGPGYSLRKCKNHLQCPFIFTSADTLVRERVPPPDKNWMGVASVSDSTNFLVAEVKDKFIRQLFSKVDTDELLRTVSDYKEVLNNAFIGMAGIYDYQEFWNALETNTSLIKGELQVSNGLQGLIPHDMEAVRFEWFDTGSETGYSYACRAFDSKKLIVKPDEHLYIENGKVIKYFADESVVSDRVRRAELLKGAVPALTFTGKHFYAYDFVPGILLSDVTDTPVFTEFLNFCKDTVWKRIELSTEEQKTFKQRCESAWHEKTLKRVQQFFQGHVQDKEEIINGEKVPKLQTLLEKVQWKWLAEGIPVLWHGDLQPENVIVCQSGFKLLDWRHNFAGTTKYGDIYYDFAKIHHALPVTHEVIRKNEFHVDVTSHGVSYKFLMKHNLLEFQRIFEQWLVDEGYDVQKVRILSALTYLNIAPLHHYPYNLFLYYYGKHMLFRLLEEKQ